MNTGKNNQPLILAVETSGRLGSVALARADKLLAEKKFSVPMRHSFEIFPAITGLLEQYDKKAVDVEQVYISAGPGSFTGLRIAVALAKSFSLANQTRIVAVDTLDVIAANVVNLTAEHAEKKNSKNTLCGEIERLAVILDAKRGQFFIAVYEKTNDRTWQKILTDCLMTADEFLGRFAKDKPVALLGEGLVYYKNKFAAPNVRFLDESSWYPSAGSVHKLGWKLVQKGLFANPVTLVPNYLRGPDVKTKAI